MSQLTEICNKYITQQQHSNKSLFFETSPFTIDYFGETRLIEKMYLNYRKEPLELLQIPATGLHVVGYLKN